MAPRSAGSVRRHRKLPVAGSETADPFAGEEIMPPPCHAAVQKEGSEVLAVTMPVSSALITDHVDDGQSPSPWRVEAKQCRQRGGKGGPTIAGEGPVCACARIEDLGEVPGIAGAKTEVTLHVRLLPRERLLRPMTVECEGVAAAIAATERLGDVAVVHLRICPRLSRVTPFAVVLATDRGSVRGVGRFIIAHPKPEVLSLTSVVGATRSCAVPFKGELRADAQYRAYFEPCRREFRLSRDKGVMKAGSVSLPFRILFTPRHVQPVNVLLVVVLGEKEEYVVGVAGATAGYEGRQWATRRGIPSEAARPSGLPGADICFGKGEG